MPIPDRIERTIDLAQPSRRVWEALTSAEGLGGWFGHRATVDLRPGGTAYVLRPDRARTPGGLGGLARRLPQTPPYAWWKWHDEC